MLRPFVPTPTSVFIFLFQPSVLEKMANDVFIHNLTDVKRKRYKRKNGMDVTGISFVLLVITSQAYISISFRNLYIVSCLIHSIQRVVHQHYAAGFSGCKCSVGIVVFVCYGWWWCLCSLYKVYSRSTLG